MSPSTTSLDFSYEVLDLGNEFTDDRFPVGGCRFPDTSSIEAYEVLDVGVSILSIDCRFMDLFRVNLVRVKKQI
jgi:hypothetical protein